MTTGSIVWLTGLPASGKTTLAWRARAKLADRGISAVVLDGDEVRQCLVPRPGHAAEEREAFYETLARLALLLARQACVVLVAATAHRRAFRERARAEAPRFLEVYVATPPDECARRDPKGLFAQAAAGAVCGLPGFDVEYEPPVAPELVARGGLDDDAVSALVDWVRGG